MTVTLADRGPSIVAVDAVFLALSSISVLLRCYCRLYVIRKFAIDDWFALLSWMLFVCYCSFSITACFHGSGQHANALPASEVSRGLKWWWTCEPIYLLSNMALKFSIGLMIIKIAALKLHRAILWTAVGIIEAYTAFYLMLFVLQCEPAEFFWTRFLGDTNGNCLDPDIVVKATYAYSVLSCLVDWTLVVVPIFIVWKLQMDKKLKVSVSIVIALGAVASTATIIRSPSIEGLANQEDFLYATTDISIWSTAETGVGLIASSIATLRLLFRDFHDHSQDTENKLTNKSYWGSLIRRAIDYVQSRGKVDVEELIRPNSIGKRNISVTTTIESTVDKDVESEAESRPSMDFMCQGSGNRLSMSQRDNNVIAAIRETWETGVPKSTVQTTITHS